MAFGAREPMMGRAMTSRRAISRDRFDAAIFDLDGVVTQTAAVHRATWKELFDAYLAERSRRERRQYEPFDEGRDYARYLDGKPRYDGAASFLASRAIELPRGTPADSPELETVSGLANRKDEIFLRRLAERGVEVFPTTLAFIERLRGLGFRIGLFSSSKNCRRVIEAAGVAHRFEAIVDGTDLARLEMRGKPAPDMLLEVVRRLGVTPRRTVGVEDAIAGVQAGRAAELGWVVGVARNTSREELLESGADLAVTDLCQLCVEGDERGFDELPSALSQAAEIGERLAERHGAIFLDYDGTLTRIVDNPADARLSEHMRTALARLAQFATVAVISGRDLEDVRQRVALEGVSYAGSHGLDVRAANGRRFEHRQAAERSVEIDAAERELIGRVGSIPGVILERKRFSLAVHYRMTPEGRWAEVQQAVEAALMHRASLRLMRGRMVFELQPDLDWDKGRAVAWLLSELRRGADSSRVLYMGDDVTDEDAFCAMRELGGISVAVRGGLASSAASYSLESVAEVQTFLDALAGRLERK
jgi:alpha,alpha-trehalase